MWVPTFRLKKVSSIVRGDDSEPKRLPKRSGEDSKWNGIRLGRLDRDFNYIKNITFIFEISTSWIYVTQIFILTASFWITLAMAFNRKFSVNIFGIIISTACSRKTYIIIANLFQTKERQKWMNHARLTYLK